MNIKKLTAILIILVLCLIFLTGCYSSNEVEALAYAVAIGLDKGSRGLYKINFAVSNFK